MVNSVQRLGKWSVAMIMLCMMPLAGWAQLTVSGQVTAGDDGSALAGATVLVKGTTQGALADDEGKFSVRVPDGNAALVISYIGFVTQEVAINGRTTINISMVRDETGLEEVIITGYTAQSKRDVTGAITSVDAGQLAEVPAANLATQLQGRAPGVMIGTDNRPGGDVMVRIRGFGTINDNNPLYVIDGVPTKGGLNQINPANIESIQILKDASAASIYGSRAANGVVVITTKKGSIGAPKVSFDARYGIQQAANQLDLLNTQQLGELLYTAQRNDYIAINGSANGFVFNHGQYGDDPNAANFIPDYIFPSGAFEGDPRVSPENYSRDIGDPAFGSTKFLITRANKEGTDWYDEIFNPAPLQEYNVGVSGGSQTGRYFLGINYFNQQGIVRFTNFERFSIRSNTQFTPKPWLRIGENLEVSFSNQVSFTNNDEGNPIAQGYRMQPIVPLYDIDGFYAGAKGANLGNGTNPFAVLERNKDNVSNNWRIFGSAYAEVDIIKDMTFKTQFGFDYGTFFGSFYSFRTIEIAEPNASNSLSVQTNNSLNWTWYNTLTYDKQFGDIHRLRVLAGTEAIEGYFQDLGGARINYFTDDLTYRVLNAGGGGITNYNGRSESALFSIFGKVNYSLMDRYLIDVTFRRDGSSRFGPENRFANFPAVSVGWRLSEESFLSGLSWLTDAKVRVGYGLMGNQEIANDNAYTTFRTSLTASSYDINGTNTSIVGGFDSQRFGNPAGRWETTTTLNAGLDLTILNALSFTFDWYDRRTDDMLYVLTLPAVQGQANAPFQNVGSMRNRGIDIGLSYFGSNATGDFSYNIDLNFSQYKNTVLSLSLDNPDEVLIGPARRNFNYTRSEDGLPISYFYGLNIIGFTNGAGAQNGVEYPGYYDRAGRFLYEDVNGRDANGDLTGQPDGLINADDRQFLGSPHPDFIYGLNVALNYKDFDLTVFVQGVQGNELINYVRRWTDFFTFQGNRSVRMYEQSWTEELGNEALLPVLSQSDDLSYQPSSYFVEDGSYLRLKNLQLGYTVSGLKQVDRLRIFFQATNLATFTRYSGLDPEVNLQFGNNNMFGFDEGIYPTPRTFVLGVNLGF
ncbi:MAG: TonB-dependent receptor [Bacteroidia bacterium]